MLNDIIKGLGIVLVISLGFFGFLWICGFCFSFIEISGKGIKFKEDKNYNEIKWVKLDGKVTIDPEWLREASKSTLWEAIKDSTLDATLFAFLPVISTYEATSGKEFRVASFEQGIKNKWNKLFGGKK